MFLVVTVNVCQYIHLCFSPALNSEHKHVKVIDRTVTVQSVMNPEFLPDFLSVLAHTKLGNLETIGFFPINVVSTISANYEEIE